MEHTELPELAVGDDQSSESAQTLKGMVAVLACSLLVDRGTGRSDGLRVPLLGLPDEVLEQVSIVLR